MSKDIDEIIFEDFWEQYKNPEPYMQDAARLRDTIRGASLLLYIQLDSISKFVWDINSRMMRAEGEDFQPPAKTPPHRAVQDPDPELDKLLVKRSIGAHSLHGPPTNPNSIWYRFVELIDAHNELVDQVQRLRREVAELQERD